MKPEPRAASPTVAQADPASSELTAHWMDVAMRPDVCAAPVQRAGAAPAARIGNASAHPGAVVQRKVVAVQDGEEVEVSDDEEEAAQQEARARQIIATIASRFGIRVQSLWGKISERHSIKGLGANKRKQMIQKSPWQLKELEALLRGLGHFAPVLGDDREESTRSDQPQELTTVSKVTMSADDTLRTALGRPAAIAGQTNSTRRNTSLFDAGTDLVKDFDTNEEELEGTVVHEVAHAVLRYALPGFIASLDYWQDGTTKSNQVGAEAPITPYAAQSASEDLSETTKFYFLDRQRLRRACPVRDAYLHETVTAWEPDIDDLDFDYDDLDLPQPNESGGQLDSGPEPITGKRYDDSLADLKSAIRDITVDSGLNSSVADQLVAVVTAGMPFASEKALASALASKLPESRSRVADEIAGYIAERSS